MPSDSDHHHPVQGWGVSASDEFTTDLYSRQPTVVNYTIADLKMMENSERVQK